MNTQRKKIRNKEVAFAQFVLNLVIIVLIFLMLYPLAMALWCALKSPDQYSYSQFYPTLPLYFVNMKTAFVGIWRFMVNTLLVAIPAITLTIMFSTMGAYAFAKVKFPGRKFLYAFVIALTMIPGVLTLIPSFVIYRDFGLLNSLWALIISTVVGSSIGNIFLLNAFFKGIPDDLFEAARIDGASEYRCYLKVAVPLCQPIIITQMFGLINGIWNDYLWPMIVISDYEKLTISPGIVLSFTGQYSANMPVQFCGYLIASIPLILLFVFGNKYYIQGILGSAIKI